MKGMDLPDEEALWLLHGPCELEHVPGLGCEEQMLLGPQKSQSSHHAKLAPGGLLRQEVASCASTSPSSYGETASVPSSAYPGGSSSPAGLGSSISQISPATSRSGSASTCRLPELKLEAVQGMEVPDAQALWLSHGPCELEHVPGLGAEEQMLFGPWESKRRQPAKSELAAEGLVQRGVAAPQAPEPRVYPLEAQTAQSEEQPDEDVDAMQQEFQACLQRTRALQRSFSRNLNVALKNLRAPLRQ